MDEREKLLQAIALQETLRGIVDDEVIDAALSVLRERVTGLDFSQVERQRKQVTIFFADLVDFTELAANLDMEEINTIQAAYFQCCRRYIEQYGGKVEKFIGDAVMAVFGIPNRHEQDPKNCVRAALGIQAAIADLNQGLALDLPLRVRIGISTGEVLVLYRGEGSFNVVGDVVNVTKRLEETAPAGGVLIDHNTYSHIRHIFPLESQPSLHVKGKSDPLQTYLVKPDGEQSLADTNYKTAVGTVPMVGREEELFRLQSLIDKVKETHSLQLVFITGDGGLGKTRLLEEFNRWLQQDKAHQTTVCIHIQTDWQSRYIPYTLLYKLLATYFDLQDIENRDALRRKFVDSFANMLGPKGVEKAYFLGQLIGLDFGSEKNIRRIKGDAEQIFGRSMHYLRQFLTQASSKQPLLIIFEDIQWADTASLNMIAQVVKRCRHLPLMIISTARPQFFEREQAWLEKLSPYEQLELRPLTLLESKNFSQSILRRVTQIPELLLQRIVQNAGGNPYYVEELVWMLIEDNIIYKEGEQWWVNEEILEEFRVPPTLTGVLQARLDRLVEEEKQVLQCAAVIGRNFWESAVEYLLADQEQILAKSKQTLDRLCRRKLIRPFYENGNEKNYQPKQPIQKAPRNNKKNALNDHWQTYTFQYPLLQEVTYNSILKANRRLYHRRMADWLMKQNEGDRVEAYAAMIAHHYDRAGDIKQASLWYGRAAEFAKQAYAYKEALNYYEQALELMPVETADPKRLPVLDGLGIMLVAHTRYDDALKTFQVMLAEAEITENRLAQSKALNRLGYVYFNIGNHQAAISSASKAEQILRSQDPIELSELATALSRKSSGLLYLGHIQESLEAGQEALDIARQINEENLISYILGEIYLCYKALGQHKEAQYYVEAGLELEEERGDLAGAARSINSLGELARLQGDFQKAATFYHRAYLTLEEIGDITYKMIVLSNLGGVMVSTGDYAASLIPLEEVIATVGNRWLALPETYRFLAEAFLGLGDGKEALAAIQKSVELGHLQNNPEFSGHAWRVLGNVAAFLNRSVSADNQPDGASFSATDCFQRSVDIFQKTGMERDLAFAYWDWGNYVFAKEKSNLAQKYWQTSHEIFIALDFPLLVEKLEADILAQTETV